MKLMFQAPFDVFSGYGNDAIELAIALANRGVDVVPFPMSIMPGLPGQFLALLGKPANQKYDVALQFSPPQELIADKIMHLAPRRLGYTMWERNPLAPADLESEDSPWLKHDPVHGGTYIDRARARRAFDGLDELLVTCPMNVDAFRAIDADVPIGVVPCGVDTEFWQVRPRSSSRPFTFVNVGMMTHRKNPFALLEAWKELKAENPDFDARLVIHTLAAGLHPGITEGAYGPDIVLSQRPLSKEQVRELYWSCDVFVSTSRGEGNNKPPMEFLSTGGPVIASDWGGHQNWLTPGCTWAVPGRVVPSPSARHAVEFEISKPALKEAMLEAYTNRALTQKKAIAAEGFARSALDWSHTAENLERHLRGTA